VRDREAKLTHRAPRRPGDFPQVMVVTTEPVAGKKEKKRNDRNVTSPYDL